MKHCIRSAPGCFGSPAPVWFSALFPEVPHLRSRFARRRCGFDWSGNQHPVVLHPSKKRGAGLPTPLKSESAGTTPVGRSCEPFTVIALTPLKSEGAGTTAYGRPSEPCTVSCPYAQAGLPPKGRDTTQVSDKFHAVLNLMQSHQSEVYRRLKGLS